ncbi:MAG: peptidylprolyl isomerase [Oligoflexia bacterium]|nr:peptidylprolyl isomerase [Oligoflexia bacterium]MBF0367212.1 peptidylprolyl isomerase [Oligoflexia bacterium]
MMTKRFLNLFSYVPVICFLVLFALLMETTIAAPAKEKKGDTIVATVDGVKITKEEFDQAYQQAQLFLSAEKVTREKILNDLINRRIGIARAYKNKLDKDNLVLSKLEDVLFHAQVSKDLEDKLKTITVSDDEVKKYYEENKEYRTAQILFRVHTNPSEAEFSAALKQALDVYEIVKKDPDKFAEMANKYSQASTAPTGGDMGFQPPPRLAPPYFEAIKGKQPDFITAPFRSAFGVHIVKVLGVKTFDQINQDLYKKIIYDTKRDKIIANYFADARSKANVKVMKENL